MIPHDIDPSLHASAPLLETLEDGFSPPPRDEEAGTQDSTVEPVDPPRDPELLPKSPS